MLCDVCGSINFFSKKVRNHHHANFYDVQRAAEQGCELCLALCEEAKSFVALDMDEHIFYEVEYGEYTWPRIEKRPVPGPPTSQRGGPPGLPPPSIIKPRPVCSIEFSAISDEIYRRFSTRFEPYVENDCDPELANVIPGRPSFHAPDSEGCFELIDSWRRECDSAHGGVCPSNSEAPLPTRVLDIGMEGNTSVFLKVTYPGEVGVYVALSHCVRRSSFLRFFDRCQSISHFVIHIKAASSFSFTQKF